MKQPVEFEDPCYPDMVWALQKGLYSLKQAGNIWNAAIYGYILELGFKCMSADLCVYTIFFKGGDRMIIAIHVDDFLVATREVYFQWLVKAMEQWYSITYHKADLCLGIKIECDGSGSYNISQQHYFEELLKELNMQDCKPSTTSMSKREVNAITVRDTGGKKLDTNSHALYHQIVEKMVHSHSTQELRNVCLVSNIYLFYTKLQAYKLAYTVKAMKQRYSITYHKTDLCLGIKIECDGSGDYNISQQHYFEELLKELNMQDCKPSTTPISKDEVNALTVRDTKSKKLDTNSHALYCQIVGKLMYAMVGTRLNLAYTLSVLGRFAAALDTYHMALAKRTLAYVKATINYRLHYKRESRSATPILTG
jgi:hypothetical protein